MNSGKTFGVPAAARYDESMSLTLADLQAIKKLFDASFNEYVPKLIDERVPKLVQPMLDKLETCLDGKIDTLAHKIDELTLDVGQFSLETTNNFIDLENRLNQKIDEVDTRLNEKIDAIDVSLNDKIDAVDSKLSAKINQANDTLDVVAKAANGNQIEIIKVKRKLGLA
jgi:hypothetical protein